MTLMSIAALVGIVSEAASAIVQLMYPQNKGLTGILASIIKITQVIKAQPPLEIKKD